jgi:hypothetical protein
MEKELNYKLESYLKKVDDQLNFIPVSDKADILSELKNTFYERLLDGQTEEEILNEMESPRELALSYMSESITKDQKFTWRKSLKVFTVYSAMFFSSISIIPTLAALSFGFFISSGLCILVGVIGLLRGVFSISLFYELKFQFFSHELEGFPALIAGLILAVIFGLLGMVCWKGVVRTVKFLQKQQRNLKYSE